MTQHNTPRGKSCRSLQNLLTAIPVAAPPECATTLPPAPSILSLYFEIVNPFPIRLPELVNLSLRRATVRKLNK